MKAYRIKYIIKDSKPPLWWRCAVPAGITFSALSAILNDIAGIEQNDEFTFELFRELRIYEATEARPLESTEWYYDVQEASSTFIDDYFDGEKRMRYYSGKNQYIIEIEERYTEVAAEDLPCVMKWKAAAGDDDLDMRIRASYHSREGNPEFVRKADILAADGVRVLACDQSPVSASGNRKSCSNSMLGVLADLLDPDRSVDERAESIRAHIADTDIRDLIPEDIFSLYYILGTVPKKYLAETACDLGLKKCSALNKDELIERIIGRLTDADFLRTQFQLLTDGEIAAFEYVLAEREVKEPTEALLDELDYLMSINYAVQFQNNVVVIPTEVEQLYRQTEIDQCTAERRKLQYIQFIVNEIVPVYYSIISVSDFCRLCSREAEPEIAPDEVMALFRKIPPQRNLCHEDNGSITNIDPEDKETYHSVRSVQSNKPYYIMNQEEIDELLFYGYPHTEPRYMCLRSFLIKTARAGLQSIDEIMHEIHLKLALSFRIKDVGQILEEHGILLSMKDTMGFIRLLTDASNHTRTFYNRGHTPNEMAGIMRISSAQKPAFIPLSDEAARQTMSNRAGTVIEIASADRSDKVRPNEQCPCGSGKKYKKCCGSHRNT